MMWSVSVVAVATPFGMLLASSGPTGRTIDRMDPPKSN